MVGHPVEDGDSVVSTDADKLAIRDCFIGEYPKAGAIDDPTTFWRRKSGFAIQFYYRGPTYTGMEQVLASSLSGYSVMTTTGSELGVLENITVDLTTGELQYLRVNPKGHSITDFQKTDDGHLLVPAEAVSAKSDYILVEPTMS